MYRPKSGKAAKAKKSKARLAPQPKPRSKSKGKPKPKPKARSRAQAAAVPAKGALLAQIPGASSVLFTANGSALLVVRQEKKTLTLFDLSSGRETPPLKTLSTASCVALSADNRLIAMGTSTGILAVESTQAGKVDWKTKASGHAVGQVLFTLDGSLVIAAAAYRADGEAWFNVFKTATGEVEKAFDPVPGAMVCHLALSPDGLFLAHSEMRSDSVLVWHLPTRQMSACLRLQRPNGPITALAFGNGVRELYIAQENRLSAWNGENGLPLAGMAVEGVQSLAVIDGGRYLVTLRAGETGAALNLWTPERGRLHKTIALPPGHYGPLSAPPGGALLALPAENECWIWKAEKLA